MMSNHEWMEIFRKGVSGRLGMYVVSGLTNGKHLQSRTAYAHKYHSCDYKPILQLYTLFKASLWICSGQISLRNITKYQANMWMTQIMFISWVFISDHPSVTVNETVVVAPIFDVPFYHATKFHHLSSHSWQCLFWAFIYIDFISCISLLYTVQIIKRNLHGISTNYDQWHSAYLAKKGIFHFFA